MEEINIYETLEISIYCSYLELIKAYSNYLQENAKRKLAEKREADKLLEEYKWLEEAKEIFDKEGLVSYFEDGKLKEFRQGAQKDILEKYYKHLRSVRYYNNINSEIKKVFQDNNLDVYKLGEDRKRQYDQTHCTPYAILGIRPFVRGHIPSPTLKEKLISKYPHKEKEVEEAFNVVTLCEKEKEDEYNAKHSTKVKTEDSKKEKPKQDNEKNKSKQKLSWKRILSAALTTLEIAGFFGVPKLLPSSDSEPLQQQPTPETTPLPDETSFRESLKVDGATISLNGDETTITPTNNYIETSFNVANITPAPTATPNNQGQLDAFKEKLQNDEELLEIARHALQNVGINTEVHGASVYDKLDYIMLLMEEQDEKSILGDNPSTGGIKNCILDLIDDVTLYYIRKETGQTGCFIRFTEEEKRKHVLTADFNVITENRDRYVATGESGIANNNRAYGTTKKVEDKIASRIKRAKLLREKDTYKSWYKLTPDLLNMRDLLLSLNTVGNERMIVSRNSQNER